MIYFVDPWWICPHLILIILLKSLEFVKYHLGQLDEEESKEVFSS